jgi:hypothetical protein
MLACKQFRSFYWRSARIPNVLDSSARHGTWEVTPDLFRFDILCCLVVAAEGTHLTRFYPCSAALNEARADPALVLVATHTAARAALFPASDDVHVAEAIHTVVQLAEREDPKYGGR